MKSYTQKFEGKNQIFTFKNSFKIVVNFLDGKIEIFKGKGIFQKIDFLTSKFSLKDLNTLLKKTSTLDKEIGVIRQKPLKDLSVSEFFLLMKNRGLTQN